MVVYRFPYDDPEPDWARKTIRFRDLRPPRPERDLVGQQYEGGLQNPAEKQAFRFVPSFSSDGWAAGVALDPDRPLEGLVGYEWDTFDAGEPPPQSVRIMHCPDVEIPADCIRWTAPSGARILSAGSLQFSWGLDDWCSPGTSDQRLQEVLRNAVRQMTTEATNR